VSAVDEGFTQVELAALDQVVSKALQYLLQHAVLHPTLEAPKASCIGWVPIRHVGPWRAGS
jgi:hypothetical protein